MKLHAYVLLGDPAWMSLSLSSYYPHVSRIIASYDRSGLGWNGYPIDIDKCMARLDLLDTDKKVVYLPGDYRRNGVPAIQLDTKQRQDALDTAAEGDPDWILQFDLDEVVPCWQRFERSLAFADSNGWESFWYPQRFVFAHLGGSWYAQMARRRMTLRSTAPGPYAVKPETKLVLSRQDGRPRNVFECRTVRRSALHVRTRDAVIHLAWIRSSETVRRKVQTSAHSGDPVVAASLATWEDFATSPIRTLIKSAVSPGLVGSFRPGRLTTLPRRDSMDWLM